MSKHGLIGSTASRSNTKGEGDVEIGGEEIDDKVDDDDDVVVVDDDDSSSELVDSKAVRYSGGREAMSKEGKREALVRREFDD